MDKKSSDNGDSIPNDANNFKKSSKERREEYFNHLRSWLATVNSYQVFYNHLQKETLQSIQQPKPPKIATPHQNVPRQASAQQTEVDRNHYFNGYTCRVPSLWKRLAAEFIDFILLSLVKFLVAYLAIDSLEINFTKYNSIIMQDDFNVDYDTAVEMTSELLFLEVTHRLVVCLYEIYWLQSGNSFEGGATIGKMLLNITVVNAEKIYHLRGQPPHVIVLSPGGDLGWQQALLRSLTKNFIFAFLFPLPFISATANQNRCAYDIICNSMVVECVIPLRCERSELQPIT
ncbi:protein FAM8A1-like [Adelges cooleyi]|uniref:protein FAM8A1-like n=1 Tax=Adelges cooleyi TaxID=133065 RepID=UPI00217F7922|nr:protein FAM8A1-like [Adelges cooleyi]